MTRTHQVLGRLLVYQLSIKAEKCELHQKTASFLGFVSPGQIKLDPEKINRAVNLILLPHFGLGPPDEKITF